MAKLKKQLKEGVSVEILKGKDRGKTGKIVHVFWKKGRATVEKMNIQKRHMKPNMENKAGGIVDKEGSIAISNLKVIDALPEKPEKAKKETKKKATKKATSKAKK